MAKLPLVVLALLPLAARAHALLDPERLQAMLVDIARAQDHARTAGGGAEAFCELGDRIEAVTELLNLDVAAHGSSDLLARLAVERLRALGIQVRYAEPERRWSYDLAAYRDCFAAAPDGSRASTAWFRLLARAFHDRAGTEAWHLGSADAPTVARAAAEEEHFLRRYPADEKAKEVRFFLAVDYYRLARLERASERARFVRLGRDALQLVLARYPGTMEARAAETLLEDLKQE